jgi:DNA-binding LacI/PurR family transcriptional regulator
VGIADEEAARRAARHLTALGHRRLAVVSFALAPDERTGPAGAPYELVVRGSTAQPAAT